MAGEVPDITRSRPIFLNELYHGDRCEGQRGDCPKDSFCLSGKKLFFMQIFATAAYNSPLHINPRNAFEVTPFFTDFAKKCRAQIFAETREAAGGFGYFLGVFFFFKF